MMRSYGEVVLSGTILLGEDLEPFEGHLTLRNGVVAEIGTEEVASDLQGIIAPALVNAHVHLGDSVDGQGDKERGIAELELDVERQGDMAAEVLGVVKAAKHYLCFGTPYHSSGSHSYERHVARQLGATIEDTQYLRADGLRISARHVVSRSDTPYGQPGLVAKELIRDLLQAQQDDAPRADIVLRGHVHTYAWIDNGMGYAGIVPCLQLPGGVFGRTQRPWWYRVGVLELRIADGYCSQRPHLMTLRDVRRRRYATVG